MNQIPSFSTKTHSKLVPHFFPGQWIDYRDFNRIIQSSENILSALNQALYPAGGIITGMLDELEVSVVSEHQLQILPGVALLPQGELCHLHEKKLLDIERFLQLKEGTCLYVFLSNKTFGQDFHKDPEDTAISGFRTQCSQGEVEIRVGQLHPAGIELARILLQSEAQQAQATSQSLLTSAIKPPLKIEDTLPQSWDVPQAGQLDRRYRIYIQGYSSQLASDQDLVAWRRSLMHLEQLLLRLQKTFSIADFSQVGVFVSLLHAELLHRPFQFQKAQFLLEEVARRLCLFLDRLFKEGPGNFPNFSREAVLKVIQSLETLNQRSFHHNRCRMPELMESIIQFNEFVELSGDGTGLYERIELALLEYQNISFDYLTKMSFGGYTFEWADEVLPKDESRVITQTDHKQIRNVSATYLNGSMQSMLGLTVTEGSIEVRINAKSTAKPLLLLFRHYLKRPGLILEYEWNGKWLHREQFIDPQLNHVFTNRALVIPSERLIQQDNRLVLRSESPAHELVFLGLVAYQPTLTQWDF